MIYGLIFVKVFLRPALSFNAQKYFNASNIFLESYTTLFTFPTFYFSIFVRKLEIVWVAIKVKYYWGFCKLIIGGSRDRCLIVDVSFWPRLRAYRSNDWPTELVTVKWLVWPPTYLYDRTLTVPEVGSWVVTVMWQPFVPPGTPLTAPGMVNRERLVEKLASPG